MWHVFAVLVVVLIGELNILPPTYSRKFVHIGAGLILADLGHPISYPILIIVQLIAILSIILSIFYPFSFGKKNDLGIISYNAFVFIWIAIGFPIKFMLPMFICDPMGFLVGFHVQSPKLYGKNTLAGSLAVLISGYFCLYFIKSNAWRIGISILICLAEFIGGKCDNFCIGLLLFVIYLFSKNMEIPLDYYTLYKPLLYLKQ